MTMKLIGSNPWRVHGISRAFMAVFFSTKAQSCSSTYSRRRESLYQKINLSSRDPKIPITSELDQWLQEGRKVNSAELLRLVKQLRRFRRYSHALQVNEWLTDKMKLKLTSDGVSVKLDLIFKVHGLDKAEEYFNSIPPSSRVDKVYRAMLDCYCETKSLQNAEDLFVKMRELGFAKLASTYNVMLTLYSRTGNHEKLNGLVQEMVDNGVKFDTYTCNIQLNAYADSNVVAMEKFLLKVEGDSEVTLDFHGYFIAAKGYLRDGISGKALNALRKAEELIKSKGSRSDYEQLITLYGTAGQKYEVYRIWDMYKNKGRVSVAGYLAVLSSLLKLKDFNGAEKIFKEWELGASGFDSRIANMFISSWCKNGFLDKALACANRFTNKGHELDGGIWQCIATQCCVDGQMEKAVETVKRVISVSGPNWTPNRSSLADCLEYLKEGNVDAALEIVGLLREKGSFSDEICDRLVDFLKSDQDCGATEI